MSACLDERRALSYLSDSVSHEIADEAEAHVEGCPTCQKLLSRLADGGIGQRLSLALAVDAPLPGPLARLLHFPWEKLEANASAEATDPPRGTASAVQGYDLIRELGRGGTGVVYLARDDRLDRLVALKVILSGQHASREELTRFRSEAMLVARLRHPNLVRVHHVGEQAGLPFCAMEYIEGGNLRQRLSAGPMPAIEAARLSARMADALQAVHSAGVVHRDLKPENVLLAADGTPRIADFGLARDLDDQGGPSLTRTSQVIGTPRYMAPEQAAGRDERNGPGVDIHALGVILHELLTGVPPFRAPTLAQTLAQVVSQVPADPRRLDPGVPIDLATICLKCLEKEPARRYPTAGALAEDLRRFLDGKPVLARPAGTAERVWRACRRKPMTAGLVTALGLLMVTLAIVGPLIAARQARLAADLRLANEGLQEAKADADAKAEEARENSELAQATINDVLATIDQALVRTQSIPLTRLDVTRKVVDLQNRFAQGPGAGRPERLRLATATIRLTEALQDLGQYTPSIDALSPTLPLLTSLIASDPEDLQAIANQTRAHALLGRAWIKLREDPKARAALTEANTRYDHLLTIAPGRNRERAELAWLAAERAEFEAKRGNAEAAEIAMARSWKSCLLIARLTQNPAEYFEGLSRALSLLSTANLTLGRPEVARRDAASAAWYGRNLWSNNPFNPRSRLTLARAQFTLALALESTQPDEAERLAMGARDVASWVIEDLPGLLEPMRLEKEAIAFLYRLLRTTGRAVEADALQAEKARASDRRTGWPASWSEVQPAPLPSPEPANLSPN